VLERRHGARVLRGREGGREGGRKRGRKGGREGRADEREAVKEKQDASWKGGETHHV
jgi:hypothetical protein